MTLPIVAAGWFLFCPQDSLFVGADRARGVEDRVVHIVADHAW